jgi:nitroreductase
MKFRIIELLKLRKATRAISPEPLPDKTIDALIEAARLTPSCYNNQPWRYIFMRSPDALEKGRSALSEGNRVWADKAPLLVAVYSKPEDDCVIKDGRAYHQFDVGMSVMNLMLAATELGLVARPIAGYDPVKIKQLYSLADADQVICMIVIGKPAADDSYLPEKIRSYDKKPRERKPAADIAKIL